MSLTQCRYNTNHKVKVTRLLIHEDSCPDRIKSNLKVCPYNPIHKVSVDKYEGHKRICDQRPKIDEDLEKEMKEYIKNKHLQENKSENIVSSYMNSHQNLPTRYGPKKIALNSSTSNAFNDQNKSISTIGLRQNEVEKNKNKERKKKQKEIMNLIDNSEFLEDNKCSEDASMSNNEQCEIDDIYDKDFNINNFNHINNFNNNFDKQSDNTLFTLSEYVNKDNFFDLMETSNVKNEYDPNESDMFIGEKNKNNVGGYENERMFENEFSMTNTRKI